MWAALVMALAYGAYAQDSAEDEPSPIAEQRLDVGVGLDLGLLVPGIKLRVLGITGRGLFAGVDIDAGSILLVSAVTASAVLGAELTSGDDVFRPYATMGGGNVHVEFLQGPRDWAIVHTGVGVEWKPRRAFGLGFEGGVDLPFLSYESNLGYGRLTVTGYVF